MYYVTVQLFLCMFPVLRLVKKKTCINTYLLQHLLYYSRRHVSSSGTGLELGIFFTLKCTVLSDSTIMYCHCNLY